MLTGHSYLDRGGTHLANDLGWLGIVNGPQVLLHGSVIVTPLVQEITILAIDGILLQSIDTNLLGKVDSQDVKIALVQDLEPLLETLFPIAKDLAWLEKTWVRISITYLSICCKQEQITPFHENGFHRRHECLAVRNELEIRIQQRERRRPKDIID